MLVLYFNKRKLKILFALGERYSFRLAIFPVGAAVSATDCPDGEPESWSTDTRRPTLGGSELNERCE